MTLETRFERILKDLDRCTQAVGLGAKLLQSLDEKVAAHRLKKVLSECRAKLRVEVFEFQHAVSVIPRKPTDCDDIPNNGG